MGLLWCLTATSRILVAGVEAQLAMFRFSYIRTVYHEVCISVCTVTMVTVITLDSLHNINSCLIGKLNDAFLK